LVFNPFIKIFDQIDSEGEDKKVIVFLGHTTNKQVKLSEEHVNYKFISSKDIFKFNVMPYIKKLFEGVINE
jgi:hypothetical protein